MYYNKLLESLLQRREITSPHLDAKELLITFSNLVMIILIENKFL